MTVGLAGHMATRQSPYHTALATLARTIQAASQGAVRLDVQADGSLGDEKEMLEKLRRGELAAMIGTATAIAGICPQASVCDFPTLFTDRTQFYRAADTVLQENFAKTLLTHRVRLLGILDGGWRDIYNSRRPILVPADLEGLKMRTMDNAIQQETYRTLGAEPMVISTHESYQALENGTVDGGDRAPSNFVEYGYGTVAGYYSCAGLSVVAAYLLVSEQWFADQSLLVQNAILKQSGEIARMERLLYRRRDENAFAQMQRNPAIQICRANRALFRDVLRPVWQRHLEEVGGEAFLRAVQQA